MNKKQFFESLAGKGTYEKQKNPIYRLVMLEFALKDDILSKIKSLDVHIRRASELIEKMEEENDYLQWFYDTLQEFQEDCQFMSEKIPEFIGYLKQLHQLEDNPPPKTMEEAQEDRWKK